MNLIKTILTATVSWFFLVIIAVSSVEASLVPKVPLFSVQSGKGNLFACRGDNSGTPSTISIEHNLIDNDRLASHLTRNQCGYYQKLSLKRLLSGDISSVDSLRLFVVRVDFPDRQFDVGKNDSLHYANELRHLYEYFYGASRGHFWFKWTIAPGIVHLDNNESYFGDDDNWNQRMLEILAAVVDSLDSSIDFSRYDAFAVIHADAGQETDFNDDSPGQIWSGFLDPSEIKELVADSLGVPGIPTGDIADGDTFYINNLIVWPEEASQDNMVFGSLGIYAYQIGLRLGMFPLFDSTPSEYPDSQGIGTFGLMGYGLYNANGFIPANPCAFHRYLMGWVSPVEIDSSCHVKIDDINSAEGDTSLVKVPIGAREYFLLANRVEDSDFDGSFDFGDVNHDGIPEDEDTLLGAEFDYFLTTPTNPKGSTGSGLFIWHIDEAVIEEAAESGFNPEDNRARKGVDLEEADGIQDLDRPGGQYAFGSFYDSFREGNQNRFGVETNPSSANNNGTDTGIEVFDISAPGRTMEFNINFSEPDGITRKSIEGSTEGFGMICSDCDTDGIEELYFIVDSTAVCRLNGAGSEDFNSSVDTVLMAGVQDTFISSPVFADIDGDDSLEIFDTSKKYILYAAKADGAPFPIDDDGTRGELDTHCRAIASPIASEVDADSGEEILVPCSKNDSTFIVMVGSSHKWQGAASKALSSSQTVEYFTAPGRLVSEGAYVVEVIDGRSYSGLSFITKSGGNYQINFVYFVGDGLPLDSLLTNSYELPVDCEPRSASILSSGDINGDGSDEILFCDSNDNLVICSEQGMVKVIGLRGSELSAVALSDINGDGVLETILITDSYAYMFTGYGVLVDGWPVALPVSGAMGTGHPFSPLVFDINGDGQSDVLFNIGGDLFAYDYHGKQLRGWPLPGETNDFGFASILHGMDDSYYLFTSGTEPDVTRRFSDSQGYDTTSFIRRYSLPGARADDQDWRFFKHDRSASGRQMASKRFLAATRNVDEKSFICYPNPASGRNVNVRVLLFSNADVKVSILTVEGEMVFSSVSTHVWSHGAVPFETSIPLEGMASGIYICMIKIQGEGWMWRGARKFAVVK